MNDYVRNALESAMEKALHKITEDILAQAQHMEPVIGDLHAFASDRYRPTGTVVESTSISIDETVLALPEPQPDNSTKSTSC